MQKHNKLKENVDKAIARSKRDHLKSTGKKMSKKQEDYEVKHIRRAAVEAEKNLPKVWNPESSNEPDTDKRPSLGYFGGVDFKEGKIVR